LIYFPVRQEYIEDPASSASASASLGARHRGLLFAPTVGVRLGQVAAHFRASDNTIFHGMTLEKTHDG
jgi:hypothetical protein